VSIVNFTVRPPSYPAVRWDGTNLADVEQVIASSRYEVRANDDGTLTVHADDREVTVRQGQWVMPAHKAVAVDDAELRQGFVEAP
jgi:hypothetical protein